MKKLFIALFLLFVSTFCFAEIKGIFDVNFGDRPDTVKSKMKKRGWSLYKHDKDSETIDSFYFEKEDGTWGNIQAENICIDFYCDRVFEITIRVTDPNATKEDLLEKLKTIQKLLYLEDPVKSNDDDFIYYEYIDDFSKDEMYLRARRFETDETLVPFTIVLIDDYFYSKMEKGVDLRAEDSVFSDL